MPKWLYCKQTHLVRSQMIVDLHCHSTFSDGQLTPSQLIDKAIDAHIALFALTDHDTLEGLQACHLAAQNKPIHIINGIELSVRWKLHDLHVIGLNFNAEHPSLLNLIHLQNIRRIKRAEKIGGLLEQCQIPHTYTKARDLAGHDRIGRRHFAEVLVSEGWVPDIASAFKRFLKRGRPAYLPSEWCDLATGIEVLKEAGGSVFIAHPLHYRLTRSKLRSLLRDFKASGGTGLEVISGNMTPQQIRDLANLCQEFEFFASSGSDYHGDRSGRISLGKQAALPENCVPIWHHWPDWQNKPDKS